MPGKKCSYCETTAKAGVGLVEQGWMGFDLWIGKGKNSVRTTRRACPDHKDALREELHSLMPKKEES